MYGTNLEESKVVKDLRDALSLVERSLNIMGGAKEKQVATADWFSRQHRTMQQAFMRTIIVPILEQLADAHAKGWTDARNAASAKMAFKMLDALSDDDKYLPLI